MYYDKQLQYSGTAGDQRAPQTRLEQQLQYTNPLQGLVATGSFINRNFSCDIHLSIIVTGAAR